MGYKSCVLLSGRWIARDVTRWVCALVMVKKVRHLLGLAKLNLLGVEGG